LSFKSLPYERVQSFIYKNTRLSRLNALASRLVMTERLSLCNERPIIICEPAFGGRGNLSLGKGNTESGFANTVCNF
jgi:hypothetical protein